MKKQKDNMKISVENYGPIAEAKDIELCPLTVFVGPSNTGKSYLAALIYALFTAIRSETGRFPLFRVSRSGRHQAIFFDFEMKESWFSEIRDLFEKNTEEIDFSDLSADFQDVANKEIAKLIGHKFHQEIARCMGVPEKENNLTGAGLIFARKTGMKV